MDLILVIAVSAKNYIERKQVADGILLKYFNPGRLSGIFQEQQHFLRDVGLGTQLFQAGT